MWEWIKKRHALHGYRTELGTFLVRLYGRQPRYTPAQVLTAIKVHRHRLSTTYAPYACAMYCSEDEYSDFATSETSPSHDASEELEWLTGEERWPEHREVTGGFPASQVDAVTCSNRSATGGYDGRDESACDSSGDASGSGDAGSSADDSSS